MSKEGTDNSSFELPQYSVAIPMDINDKKPNDFIAICPYDEMDWVKIGDKYDRKRWGYTYLAPILSQKDDYMLHIDVATTFEKTTKKIGPAIIVDFSKKVTTLADGWYHIRYYRSKNGWKFERKLKDFAIKDGKYIPF